MFLYSYFNLCSTGILSMDEYIMVVPARLQCATLAYSYMYMECICHCAIAILPSWETNMMFSIEMHLLVHWTPCTRPHISGPILMVSIEIHLLVHWTACTRPRISCFFVSRQVLYPSYSVTVMSIPALRWPRRVKVTVAEKGQSI